MIDYKNLLRSVEIISLLISIVGWPILFFRLGLQFYLLSLTDSDPFKLYIGIIICIFIGLIWDTRFFAGGHAFVKPLKKYFSKEEIQNDILLARLSLISNFFIFLLFLD